MVQHPVVACLTLVGGLIGALGFEPLVLGDLQTTHPRQLSGKLIEGTRLAGPEERQGPGSQRPSVAPGRGQAPAQGWGALRKTSSAFGLALVFLVCWFLFAQKRRPPSNNNGVSIATVGYPRTFHHQNWVNRYSDGLETRTQVDSFPRGQVGAAASLGGLLHPAPLGGAATEPPRAGGGGGEFLVGFCRRWLAKNVGCLGLDGCQLDFPLSFRWLLNVVVSLGYVLQ